MESPEKALKSWTSIINSYEQSQLSKSKFCKQNKLRPSQFYYWCNKIRPDLKSELHSQRASKDSFIPIKSSDAKFCVYLDGIKLEFEKIPEVIWLAKLFKSVGELNDQHR